MERYSGITGVYATERPMIISEVLEAETGAEKQHRKGEPSLPIDAR